MKHYYYYYYYYSCKNGKGKQSPSSLLNPLTPILSKKLVTLRRPSCLWLLANQKLIWDTCSTSCSSCSDTPVASQQSAAGRETCCCFLLPFCFFFVCFFVKWTSFFQICWRKKLKFCPPLCLRRFPPTFINNNTLQPHLLCYGLLVYNLTFGLKVHFLSQRCHPS